MRKITAAAILTLVTLASGCASVQTGTDMGSSEKVRAEIIKNVTTKAEIATLYGSPFSTAINQDGSEVWTYAFNDINASVDAATFIPIVGIFAGGSNVQMNMKTLIVTFDESGVVSTFSYSDANTSGEYSTLGGYKGS